MKKISLLSMAVIPAFAFISCSKETPAQDDTVQNESSTAQSEGDSSHQDGQESAGGQDLPHSDRVPMTFFVVTPWEDEAAQQDGEDGTKTTWDGSAHGWAEGDQVEIFWGAGDEEHTTATVVDGKIEANVGVADVYYACYPARDADNHLRFALRANGKIDFYVPDLQRGGTFGNANMMVARASGSGSTFHFKNVTHILKFTTSANTYKHFRFCSNINNDWFRGTRSVTFHSDDSISIGDPVSTTVSGQTVGNSKFTKVWNLTSAGTYYFAVLPEADLSEGFCVQADNSGSTTWDYDTSGSRKDENCTCAISRRAIPPDDRTTTITNLGTITPLLHQDWFIAETAVGAKDGRDWDNAGDLSLFINLIAKPTSGDRGINSTRRLHNARIHFKEGTYNLQAEALQRAYPAAYTDGVLTFGSDAWSAGVPNPTHNVTKIDGGYPSTNTGTSLSGQDPAGQPTYWTCNMTAADKIFYACGCHFADWTFDGITFDGGGSAIAASGMAFTFDNGAQGKVTFSNCIFKQWRSSNTSGSLYGSGALVVDTDANLQLSFEDCAFTNNRADRGAAAVIRNTHAGSLVSFTGCTFTSKADGNGASFYIYSGGKAYFEDCSFAHSNFACDGTSGGAGTLQSGAVVTLKDCNFTDLVAYGVGGALLNHGTLNIEGGSFSGCLATTNSGHSTNGSFGGAIYSDGTVTATGTEFSSNKSLAYGSVTQEEGGGAIASVGGTLTLNGCTFDSNTSPKGGALYARGASVTIRGDNGTRSSFTGNQATGRTDATTGDVYQIPMDVGGAIAVVGGGSLTVVDTDFGTSSADGDNSADSVNAATDTDKEIGGGCVFIDDRDYISENSVGAGSQDPFDPSSVTVLIGDPIAQRVTFTDCNFYGNTAGRGGAVVVRNTHANSLATFEDCTFNRNSATDEGGTFFVSEGAHALLDGTGVSGTGKTAATAVATYGGGIYNAGNLTLRGGCVVEQCNTGGYYGAGIYNAGSLNIDGCTIQNNMTTGRGGGIWSCNTLNIENSTISGNQAGNGGGLHCDTSAADVAADTWIVNTTFSSNQASNGSAIRALGNENAFARVRVFNSLLFDNLATNTSSSASEGKDGGCVHTCNYSRIIVANSTLAQNTHSGSATLSVNGNYGRIYMISSTLAGNTSPDIMRGYNYLYLNNSIIAGTDNTIASVGRKYTFWYDKKYDQSGSGTSADSPLGSYSDGVYILDGTKSPVYNSGADVSTIKGWTYNNITLSDDQKDYLGYDQKGNPRTGSIMGAYVKTTAP